jgi:hypothetical protein
MGSDNVLDQIINSGVVAIMRAKSSDQLLAAAEAILGGGVNTIEVTMTTPRNSAPRSFSGWVLCSMRRQPGLRSWRGQNSS